MFFGLLLLGMTAQAQTAKKFTLNLTDDGKAQMVCFIPETPSGKAIVGVPGGGYSMLSNTHEGYLASDWLNQQGIAYFVVNYRLPNGDRTLPMGDVQKGIRIVRDSAAVWGINPHDVGIMGFSILSSRWMSVCPTSGHASISWVRKDRRILSWFTSSQRRMRYAVISRLLPLSSQPATIVWCLS